MSSPFKELGEWIYYVRRYVREQLKQKDYPVPPVPVEPPKDGVAHRYKLIFIGGGEIALELALVGVKHFWESKCIEIPGRVMPMIDFPAVANITNVDENFYTEIDELYTPWKEGHKDTLTNIEDFILQELPDTVLLERNFIPLDNWKTLCRDINYLLKEDPNRVKFIPTLEGADFFCNKIIMKQKLEEILGDKEYLVKYESIKIDDNNNINKIEESLKKINPAIIKPPITESGYGQTEIGGSGDIEFCLDRVYRQATVKPQKEILLEEKVEINSEVYYAAFRPFSNLDSVPKIIGPIQYKKKPCGHGGPVRLIEARYPSHDLKEQHHEIMKDLLIQLCESIKVPFLGVEYFLCEDNKIYINEITWRPDDAGFITLLSHKPNQFELFISSFEKSELEEPRENDGEFYCFTILRKEKLNFDPPTPKIPGKGYTVHFYNKGLPTTYKRIVGYAIVDLKNSDYSDELDFKENLKKQVLATQFGPEEVDKFYF